MKLGEKIKAARRAKRITQSALAGDKITRNMISRIENGTATPSLDTIRYLADALSLPVSYLLSESDDLLFYEKNEKIQLIYDAYAGGEYEFCVKKILGLSAIDNELAYLLASSYFELGRKAVRFGSLHSALKYFEEAEEYCKKTVFDTRYITSVLKMYRSIAANIQAPLLEFDPMEYEVGLYDVFDYETYRYLMQDYYYDYKNECLLNHVKAKLLIKERRYQEALKLLLEAAEKSHGKGYNSFVVFGIYADLEQCYKQLYDFENAYKYSSKRLSMLEGFKS